MTPFSVKAGLLSAVEAGVSPAFSSAEPTRLPLQSKAGLPSRSLGEGWFAEGASES